MLNVFFVCCKKCDEFNTSAERIRLRLKNMFTAYSYLNFKKIYEVFKTNDKMKQLLYAERYLLLIDDKEASSRVIDVPTCLSDGFHLHNFMEMLNLCLRKMLTVYTGSSVFPNQQLRRYAAVGGGVVGLQPKHVGGNADP
ncbi:unnamed protein product [Toxocara canis]|uniref:Uncharacterized protein n=1 Tax=Toxocara canis TaxID=6265 RepID=A0A183VFI4_TOXCA|nr:unnamed protein product [Toxocara canis]